MMTGVQMVVVPNISLRDWLAMQAMVGLLSNPRTGSIEAGHSGLGEMLHTVAATAYAGADAMLAEREKGPSDGQSA